MGLFSSGVFASGEGSLTEIHLIFPDRILAVNFQTQPELLVQTPQHYLLFHDQKIPVDLQGDLPQSAGMLNVQTEFITQISQTKLEEFFSETSLSRERTHNTVEVNLDEAGFPVFEGEPHDGFEIDYTKLTALMNRALQEETEYIVVPATKVFSQVVVHPDLQEDGIQEIIAVGESNFAGSSPARRQNIRAAAAKFNGVIIPRGRTFSFNETLDSVSEADGFVQELVIKGNKTEKELGGGVCQVSTTAFRAAFSGGLPIVQRRNHSYAVPYYKPYGLDATIYLGAQDLRFRNDTPGAILIQTFVQDEDVFFVFYGTDDMREVSLEGPFISGYTRAPDPIVYESEDIPEGQEQQIAGAHDGFRAEWIRRVLFSSGQEETDSFVSVYRAWPARVLRGVASIRSSSAP